MVGEFLQDNRKISYYGEKDFFVMICLCLLRLRVHESQRILCSFIFKGAIKLTISLRLSALYIVDINSLSIMKERKFKWSLEKIYWRH